MSVKGYLFGLLLMLSGLCQAQSVQTNEKVSHGQNRTCNIDELYNYLYSKGLATENDKGFIRCNPIVREPDGNGVFQFGIDETDSFTFFFIKKNGQIHYVDNSKIDYVLNDVSAYLKGSNFSTKDKLLCYQKIIEILRADTIDYPWYLPQKD